MRVNEHVIIQLITAQAVYVSVMDIKITKIGKLRPHDLKRTFVKCLFYANMDINTV